MALTKKQYKQAVMDLIDSHRHTALCGYRLTMQDENIQLAKAWKAIAADLTILGAEIEELV